MKNRLAHESSPYLLQHAENPVEWFPWGREAFEKARREDKPLLISIGYSTCHWCHVMERECFENPSIAAVMNEHVVAVKVDREERPDVDRLYMTAVQAMTGQGGWPLNVFVTPEGKPFTGGTYFPPEDRHGRRGWPAVVEAISKAWRDPATKSRLLSQGDHLTQATREYLVPTGSASSEDTGSWEECRKSLEETYDDQNGGFSRAPKFPMPVNTFFLFRYAAAVGGPEGAKAQSMAVTSLSHMARGGLFDQVGGGFHRYSTDDRWFLPHFEKMLYDNAQLAVNYVDAFHLTGEDFFAGTARATLDYLLRDLCHPEGGFFSAEDADSFPQNEESTEKREGAFYVWEAEEIRKVIGDVDFPLFASFYGVFPEGNVTEDPQGEFGNKNILHEARPLAEVAGSLGISVEESRLRLGHARAQLLSVRSQRPRPHLDDKILTSWNGLALTAFARAAIVLDDTRYRAAAQRAAKFLKQELWDGERLFRRWREGKRAVFAFADDHAFLAQGLVDLYEADFDVTHLLWAEQLMDITLKEFQDPTSGALFSSGEDQDPFLLFRAREEGDNVEPSAASVSVLTLLRLGRILGREDFGHAADRMMKAHFATAPGPRAYPALQAARLYAQASPSDLVIVGDASLPATQDLIRVGRSRFRPNLTVRLLDEGSLRAFWVERVPFLENMGLVQGQPAAYLCHHFTCQPPVTDGERLRALLYPQKFDKTGS